MKGNTKMKIKTNFLMAVIGLMLSGTAMAEAGRHDFSDFRARAQYLLSKHTCTACHQVDVQSTGPSFREIADRYRDKKTYKYHGFTPKYIWSMDTPMVAGLVKKISLGGDGEWGGPGTPMPQMDAGGAKKGELEELVKAILELPPLPEEAEEEEGVTERAPSASTNSVSNKAMEDDLRKAQDELRAPRKMIEDQAKASAQSATPPAPPRTKVWSGSNAY
ncbi:MAG: hypothetical protein COW02_05115 [Comamonadaceae bacterium CG12_big_fil_rev_8_21_14_0_65_59_15]|nr:MAG: hypothetical protein COW02_05115 [Comamonadaceae bacterium CG12_big_fil_rev_8_21_14_0_65_59_15]